VKASTQLTKLDESIGSRDAVHLAAIQLTELPCQLLQVLEGQLFGVALLSEGEEAGITRYEVVERARP